MRNSLQPLYSSGQVAAALAAAGLAPEARAQDLTLADFVALAWQLQGSPRAGAEGAAAAESGAGEGKEAENSAAEGTPS